ncbi:hypothetical protein ACFXGI_17465 [Streptomyces sp. NPDC059355]|uniref:hypothetical protein n=1 Tax=Streptomyces sp. NPDC059355 TaxID=3346811 RepID=UPI0036C21E9B
MEFGDVHVQVHVGGVAGDLRLPHGQGLVRASGGAQCAAEDDGLPVAGVEVAGVLGPCDGHGRVSEAAGQGGAHGVQQRVPGVGAHAGPDQGVEGSDAFAELRRERLGQGAYEYGDGLRDGVRRDPAGQIGVGQPGHLGPGAPGVGADHGGECRQGGVPSAGGGVELGDAGDRADVGLVRGEQLQRGSGAARGHGELGEGFVGVGELGGGGQGIAEMRRRVPQVAAVDGEPRHRDLALGLEPLVHVRVSPAWQSPRR